MNSNKQKYLNLIPAFIVMSVIWVSSSTPGYVINNAGLGSNKLHVSGHSLIFFLLCFCVYKAKKNVLFSIIFSILYAVIDELNQSFTPLRSASLFDILVDAIGIVLAGLILWKLQPIMPTKLKVWLNK